MPAVGRKACAAEAQIVAQGRGADFPALAQVPAPPGCLWIHVLAAAGGKLTGALELYLNHRIGVSAKAAELLALGQVPQLHRPVIAAREGRLAVRRQGDAEHRSRVTFESV